MYICTYIHMHGVVVALLPLLLYLLVLCSPDCYHAEFGRKEETLTGIVTVCSFLCVLLSGGH